MMYDFFVFAVLIIMIFVRACVDEGTTLPINLCIYVALLIAMFDLYKVAEKKFGILDKFHVFRGVCILCVIFLAGILVCILFDMVRTNSKINDIVTILTLLLSLSRDLIIDWIGRYLNGK